MKESKNSDTPDQGTLIDITQSLEGRRMLDEIFREEKNPVFQREAAKFRQIMEQDSAEWANRTVANLKLTRRGSKLRVIK